VQFEHRAFTVIVLFEMPVRSKISTASEDE
jgi:hypothetical protein